MNTLNQLTKKNKQTHEYVLLLVKIFIQYIPLQKTTTNQHYNIEHTYYIYNYNSNLLVVITPSLRPNER